MGRPRLERSGLRGGLPSERAGSVGQRPLCGGLFHDGRRRRGQLHRHMGRQGWSALGSGVNGYGYVSALAVSGSDLYAGGSFTTAGGKVTGYVAKAAIGPPPFYFVTTN